MSETADEERNLYERTMIYIGLGIGYLICEPQLRLGRRRHDNQCDRCGSDCGAYRCEKLLFGDEPEGRESTLKKMRRMANATYIGVCIECGDEIEAD